MMLEEHVNMCDTSHNTQNKMGVLLVLAFQ